MALIRDLIIRSGVNPDTGNKTFIRIGDEKPASLDNTASSILFLGDLRDNNKSFDTIETASAFRIRHDTVNGALYILSSTNSNKHTLILFQDEGYVNIIAPTNFLATTTFDDITFDNIYGNNIFISTNSYISNSLIIGTGVNTSSFYYNNGYIIILPHISSSGTIKAKQFTSSIATGTPPFSISSNTLVANLNSDLLDGKHSSDFLLLTGGTLTGDISTSGNITAKQFTSSISAGTPPFKVTSNTVVNNLNSDLLDGTHSTGFLSINGGTLLGNLIISNPYPAYIRIGTPAGTSTISSSILLFVTNTNQSFDTANNSGSIRLRHDTNRNKLFFEAKNKADVISTPIVISYNTSSLSETNLNLGISLRPLNQVVDFNYNAVTNMVIWPNCYDVTRPTIKNAFLNCGDVLTGLLDQPGSYYTSLVGTGSITEIDIAVNDSGINNGYGRTVGLTFSVGSATGTGKVIVDAVDNFGRIIALHVDPNNRGSGYSKTIYICYSGSSPTMRCQVIATGSGGSILQVDLVYLLRLYGGTGYAVGDTLSIVSSSDYSGLGATVKVLYVDELGRCRYASLLESGSGYTTGKYNTIALTGTGSGCIIYVREISQSNRPPASGNIANIFRTPTSTYVQWNNINDNNPVQLTIVAGTNRVFGAQRLFIVNGYRNQCPFKYKVEMMTEGAPDYLYSRRWYTLYEQTNSDILKIKPYNKYINLQVNTEQATRIRITVYQAGDSDFSQQWALQNLIGYLRYIGYGRFTGYMMSAFGDTAYGNYIINGYARLTSSTPTLNLAGGNSTISVTTNNSLTLRTNNTNRMTILNDGKVGINKTNPSVLLDVAGDVNLGNASSNIINVAGQLTSSAGISTSLVNVSTGYTSSTGYLKVGGDIISNNNLSSPSFISGFNGSGWIISKSTIPNTRYTAVFDDLWIRGSMNVYELIINQIQSTNGSLWITDAGKATSASYNSSNKTLVLKFDSGSYIPFVPNDIIRTKRWGFSNSGANIVTSSIWDCITTISAINYAQGLVTLSAPETNNNYTYTSSANGTWTNFANNISISGSLWVRVGNVNTSSRQGAIYLTSTDLGGPFLDVYNSVSSSVLGANGNSNNVTESKLKLRLGNLLGLNLAPFGQMQGYGLYADNVYLRGTINATAGQIAGWTIQSNKLNNYSENNVIELTPTYLSFKNLMGYHLIVGYDTLYFNNFGVGFFYDLSPDNYYFKVDADGAFINGKIQANEGYIGGSNGWIIDTNKISSSYGIEFSNSTTPAIKIGATNYGNKGIWIGKGLDNNFSMSLYNDTNNYLKWNGQNLLIKANNFTLSTAGNISASNAILGGTIYANSGQFSGSINALSGYIGGSNGWIILTNKLRAQNNYIILQNDSSNPYISIGNVTAYNQNNGIWLGRDNNTNKISIRNSAGTQYILWDGTNLNILTPNFILSNTSLTVKGTVSSTQGDIGGWNISNTQLKSNDNNFVLDSANKTITISANNALRIGHFNLPPLLSVSVITNNLDLSLWDGYSHPYWSNILLTGQCSAADNLNYILSRLNGGYNGIIVWEIPITGSIRAGLSIKYSAKISINSQFLYSNDAVFTLYIRNNNTTISSISYTELQLYQLGYVLGSLNFFKEIKNTLIIYEDYSNLKFGFSWSGSSALTGNFHDLYFYGGKFYFNRNPEAYISYLGLHFQYGATDKYIRLSSLESKLSNILIDSELFKLGYQGQLRGNSNSITLSLGSNNANSTKFIATDRDVYMSGSNFMILNGLLQGGTGGGGSGISHSVVGTYLANLSNPSNYSYIKINTNGTVDYKTPSDVLSDIGAVPTSRTITATSPLTGGGTLSNNITIGHNNSAGSLHLPSGGSAGKFIIYGGSNGSGSWSTQTTNSFALTSHTHNPSDINSGLFNQNIGVDNNHTFSANNIDVNRLMVNNYIAMYDQASIGNAIIAVGDSNDSIGASIGLINGNSNIIGQNIQLFLIVGDYNQIHNNNQCSVIEGTNNIISSNLTHINVKGKDAVAIISGSKVFADGNLQNFNNNFAFQTHQILLSGVCTFTDNRFIFKNDFYPDGVIYLNNLVYNSNATNSFAIYIDGILLESHNYPYNFEQNFIVNLHDDIIVSSGMFGMSLYNNRSAGDFLSLDILDYGNGGIIIRGNNLLELNLKVGLKIDILLLDTWSKK